MYRIITAVRFRVGPARYYMLPCENDFNITVECVLPIAFTYRRRWCFVKSGRFVLLVFPFFRYARATPRLTKSRSRGLRFIPTTHACASAVIVHVAFVFLMSASRISGKPNATTVLVLPPEGKDEWNVVACCVLWSRRIHFNIVANVTTTDNSISVDARHVQMKTMP